MNQSRNVDSEAPLKILFERIPTIGEARATTEIRRIVGLDVEILWSEFDHEGEEVDVLVSYSHFVGPKRIERIKEGGMVSLAATGHNEIDVDACNKKSVSAYFVPGYSTASVTELALLLTLAVLRRIVACDRGVRAGTWDGEGVQPGLELSGKVVGILGTGAIGCRSASAFTALGCKILGNSRSQRQEFIDVGGEYCGLSDLLRVSDVVCIHLPACAETKGLLSAASLALMKPTAILVNVSRADIVDEKDLVEALNSRSIAGAGLDVQRVEGPGAAQQELAKCPNVILTPHVGFKTVEALARLDEAAIRNIGRWIKGDTTNLVPGIVVMNR